MNQFLKFTVKDIRNFYRKLELFASFWMESRYQMSVTVYLTRFLPLGYGGICDSNDQSAIYIGTGRDNSGVFGRKAAVSDLQVVRVLVMLFHQCEHLRLRQLLHTGDFEDEEDAYLFCQYLASKVVSGYFDRVPSSLDIYAEWHAIVNVYHYLCTMYESSDVESVLLLYVKMRLQESSYWIPVGHYQHLVDVLEAFEEQYEWSKLRPRYVTIADLCSSDKSDDMFQQIIAFMQRPDVCEVLLAIRSAESQDKVLATIFLLFGCQDSSFVTFQDLYQNEYLDFISSHFFGLEDMIKSLSVDIKICDGKTSCKNK